MNDVDTEQDRLIRSLAPVHHVPAAVLDPTGPAASELLREILAGPVQARPVTPVPPRTPRASVRWRRLAIALPTIAAAAAVAWGVAAVLPSDKAGPVGTGPAQAQALRFTESGGFLEIRIVDPAADPERYRREIADRGLDIELKLVPARAEQVGRVVFTEESVPGIESIEQPGNCTENGNCSVGVRVPTTYRGHAVIVFGREAKPGEEVEGGTSDDHALARSLVGKTVADMKRILAAAGKTPSYRTGPRSLDTPADQIPNTWIVNSAAPVPGNVIVVWVSVDGKPEAGPDAPDVTQSPKR
jgi:hypothetical protein